MIGNSEYIFNNKHKIDWCKNNKSGEMRKTNSINKINDYIVYIEEFDSEVIDETHIEVDCGFMGAEDCIELGDILCGKIFDLSNFEYIDWEFDYENRKIIIEMK